MIAETISESQVVSQEAAPKTRTRLRFVVRTGWGLWKWLLGALSCQTAISAVVGAGWGYRMAKRSTLKTWWKCSEGNGESFRSYARSQPCYAAYERTPHWIVGQTKRERWRWVGSLRANGWIGFRAWIHASLFLVVPACLMMFSWYSGWDNSFNKGYEQFSVGAVLGWIGMLLFVGVMLYLPMAQARFAVTNEIRSFYQFRLLRAVIRHRWLGCVLLAGAYSVIHLPLMVMGSFLGVAAAESDITDPNALAALSPPEALAFLKQYFFLWGFYAFAAFVALRVLGAKVYAHGLLAAARRGRLAHGALHPWEREALQRLGLGEEISPRGVMRRAGNTIARAVLGGTLAVLLWTSLALQGYVTQFFTYQPEIRRWGNQPLIQIPWIRHLPKPLLESQRES